jgi:hypothetical protein
MSERRKKKLVDNFQYRLIGRIVGYWLIYQVTLLNFLFCMRLLQEGPGNVLDQLGRFGMEFVLPSLACFAILVPAFAWDAVKFYHRVAGPVYRFRQAMQAIAAEATIRPVKLRDGDELVEMQEDFNRMLDTLARRGGVTLEQPGSSSAPANEPTAFRLVPTNAFLDEDNRGQDETRRTAL